MVDETLILRKLSELDEYLKQIKEYEGITVAEYSHEWKTQRVIERTLQMMIETCVDMNYKKDYIVSVISSIFTNLPVRKIFIYSHSTLIVLKIWYSVILVIKWFHGLCSPSHLLVL